MNLAEYKPNLLNLPKFSETNLVLTDHCTTDGDEGTYYYQTWESTQFKIDVRLTSDLLIEYGLNIIHIDQLAPTSYYQKFKNFIPPLVKQLEQEQLNFTLTYLEENIGKERFTQRWVCGTERLEVKLDESCQVKNYYYYSEKDGQYGERFYTVDGQLYKVVESDAERNKQVKEFSLQGQLTAAYSETGGIKVGLASYYTEDGQLIGEIDYDVYPTHTIGYRNARQIATVNGVDFPAYTQSLTWYFKTYNSQKAIIFVDAMTGEVEKKEAPKRPVIPEIIEPRGFMEFLREMVGANNFYIGDHEGFVCKEDYLDLFEAMRNIAADKMSVEMIEINERHEIPSTITYDIQFSINKVVKSFSFSSMTDWIEIDFIRKINEALRESGAVYTFYSVMDIRWGQDLGLVFLPDATAKCIEAYVTRSGLDMYWGGIRNFVDINTIPSY
ncbi:hypothetical protein LX64_01376 [Chitinophaga skermanii]|uniref:Uncharacterized protein n=1 Tax=Chitinophaga skermanii TaxID=331697 RepID=A0A327QYL9_9BACT|nr:hypothetical protein [Chitinophaga skermanii]RAJ08722.1 hypothetical protein LX64_01376 [Chitinophaga skermanii]